MPHSENDGRRDVVADINYFAADGTTRQPGIFKKPTYGANTEYARSMTIHDIRPIADEFKLDVNGFQFVKLPAKDRSLKDDETIQRTYYPELEGLVKDLTGASTVHAFHHVIRQTTDAPSGHPHVDYCGVPELLKGTRAELSTSPQADKLYDTCSRYCYVNTWRPLKTVHRDPLALADATTVPASDYQLRARKFPSGVESGNYIMSHGSEEEQHQWYYMYEMSPNDLVIFKGYDTKQDLPGWRCPHTAIVLEGTEDLPPRESIECRAVCFWE